VRIQTNVLAGVKPKGNTEIDLFENYEALPKKVQDLLNTTEDKQSYEHCKWLLEKLKPLGYTFEYGLDAIPYNLRKIKASSQPKKKA